MVSHRKKKVSVKRVNECVIGFCLFANLPPNVINKLLVSLYPLASARVWWLVIQNLVISLH